MIHQACAYHQKVLFAEWEIQRVESLLVSGSLHYTLPGYIDADGWKSNFSVIPYSTFWCNSILRHLCTNITVGRRNVLWTRQKWTGKKNLTRLAGKIWPVPSHIILCPSDSVSAAPFYVNAKQDDHRRTGTYGEKESKSYPIITCLVDNSLNYSWTNHGGCTIGQAK